MGGGASAPRAAPSSSEKAILEIGEILHDSEEMFAKGDRSAAFKHIATAHVLLPQVSPEQADNYTTMVHAREGKMYFLAEEYERATQAFAVAIQRAEIRIAERRRGLYLLLQRYAECMVDQCKIWEMQGDSEKNKGLKAKRYSSCEVGLLRCVEVIEEGHNRRSDLLVLPLTRLAALYEKLALYKKAELLLRRCQGIIIVQYGYEHNDLQKIDAKLATLEKLNEAQLKHSAAIKIQSIVRMMIQRKQTIEALHRPMPKRHELAPPAIRNERDKGEYLTKISNLLEPGTAMGHQVVGDV